MMRYALGVSFAAALAASMLPALAQQEGARPLLQGPQPLVGRITARSDKGFDMQTIQLRGGGGQQIKVTVADDTKLSKIEECPLAEVTENYLVAAFGPVDAATNKVSAQGILRAQKIEGQPDLRALRGYLPVILVLQRLFTRQAGQGQPGGQRLLPTIGIVTATNPLKLRTYRRQQQPGEAEVATTAETKVSRLADLKLADLPADTLVLVVPKEEPKEGAAAAAMVVQLPRMGGR